MYTHTQLAVYLLKRFTIEDPDLYFQGPRPGQNKYIDVALTARIPSWLHCNKLGPS